ncbi:hypothetical protein PR202_gb12998 [Eleusine coracana subsp. coracana]|uniref:Disease resistance protein n=1 Tax=Eleusine coracana subsp. coracana TaxID=191504 RepID=A0AAV5ESM8_ELECO|nr:hypothetical protein PR202_gb12998 [Eleusine coracana subsp. coracana]
MATDCSDEGEGELGVSGEGAGERGRAAQERHVGGRDCSGSGPALVLGLGFHSLSHKPSDIELATLQFFAVSSFRDNLFMPLKASRSFWNADKSIGKLPNLEFLRISGANAVTKIGAEFVCCGVDNPGSTEVVAFPKLEILIIEDMPNLKEWSFGSEEEASAATTNKEEREGTAAIQIGEAARPRMQLLLCLKGLELLFCPKLRALPRQLGREATSLNWVLLHDLNNLKVVENLPFLSEELPIQNCESLERVTNLQQVSQLRLYLCPNLMCVEKLDNLQQLFLNEDMQEISSLWVPELQEQRQQFHGEDLDVYHWT